MATSDVVIESFPPGYLAQLGLGYEAICKVNPGLILTSISPFGQTGPFQDYEGPYIVGMAMGGHMCLTGYPDSPPLRKEGMGRADHRHPLLDHRHHLGVGRVVDSEVEVRADR